MLILFRKKGELVETSDDIEIFVMEIRGDKVRLGISASKSMKICRTGLYLMVGDNREASNGVDLLKVFQLSRSLKALGTKGGQKKEGKDGAA